MKKVLVLLAPGFEEIEAVTIIDLLRRAGINIITAGISAGPTQGSHAITIIPDTFIDDISEEEFDAVIFPGGQPGTNNLKNSPEAVNLVREFRDKKKLIAAICSAPLVLETAGILANRTITSYPSDREAFTTSLYKEEKVVDDGDLITSRGVGTAIDFGLKLIERLTDSSTAEAVAKKILYFN